MATDPRTIIDPNQDPGLSPQPNNTLTSNVADYDTREKKTVIIDYTDPPLYGTPELQIFNDPGGSNGQVQFNKGNRFGGDNNLVWNAKIRTLSVLGNIRVSGEILGRLTTNTTKLKITGGNIGDVLTTDGLGNISWTDINLNYGNTNVANYLPTYTGNVNGSNLIISNTAYIYNISSTGLTSLTTANVSGNLTANAIYTDNYFYANGSVVPIGVAGNSLVNGNNSFALDIDGNVVFEGNVAGAGVNRGLVWDYGANVNGVNSQVRQDNDGITVRAWTEDSGNYAAPVNIVTNQDANTKQWIFDGNGNLTLPGNLIVPEGNIESATISPAFSSAITGITTGNATVIVTLADLVFGDPFSGTVTISGVTGTTEANGVWGYQATELNEFQLYTDATLTTPVDGTTWTAYVSGGNAVGVGTYTDLTIQGGNVSISSNDNTWEFGNDGNLTLPAGGTIAEGGGLTGAIKLTPAGGANDNQALLIYPTGTAEGDHIHLTAGGGPTELYLGSDYQYVKLVNGGNVEVQASQPTSPYDTATWTFGTDGRLINLEGLTLTAGGQFNICTILTGGSGYDTGSALKATTGGSGTGMTVGIGYGLSNQLTNADVVDPGTGYVDGDVITVSGGTGGTFVITQYNEQANQGNNNFIESNWVFDIDGNLTLPGNTFAVNYANGTQVSIGGGSNTGNVTFDDNIVIGTSNLKLQPDSTNSSAYLDIYLTGGPDIHIAGNGETVILGTDDFANVTVNVDGNVSIQSGNASGTHTWNFGTDGNLTLPGDIFAVNYSNGTQVSLGGSYSNADVANYLPTYTGNVSANYFIGDGSQLTGLPAPVVTQDITSTGAMSIMTYDGTIKYVNYATVEPSTGNITGNYFIGNGSVLTSITGGNVSGQVGNALIAGTVYTNAQPNITSLGALSSLTITANITSGNADLGNLVTANYFTGNGSLLTGITAGTSYANSNVATFLASFGSNTISTTGNVSAGNFIGTLANGNSNITIAVAAGNVVTNVNGSTILTTYSGGIKVGGSGILQSPGGAGSITLNNNGANIPTANITTQLNVTGASGANILGTTNTGIGALNVGVTTTPLANTVTSFNSNVNYYTQVTLQNKSTGTDATADFVITADNGSDTVNYADFGIINSGYDANTPTNSLGNIVYAADTYIYAQGNASATGQSGGNLAIGTTVASKTVKIFAGGVTSSNIVATFANTGLAVTGNVTATNFSGNISITGNVIGTSPNVSLVAGSYTMTFDNTGILTLPRMGGDEGGEINLGIPASNTTLSTRVVLDVYQDRLRFFDGSTKGAYIDLSQASSGVGTLLNNRVSGLVNAGTFVTMDLIKATVTSSGNRGLSLATTTGTVAYSIGGTYGMATPASGGSAGTGTLTTTATASIFNWGFTSTGDTSTYILTDTTNSRAYRITLQIGASFNNNMISIERLI